MPVPGKFIEFLAGQKTNTYADIVAPLKKIEENLSAHITTMSTKRAKLLVEKDEIDKVIAVCDDEELKSLNTMTKIGDLLN